MIDTLLQDTNFWVLISFVLFVALVFKAMKSAILSKLDGRIAQVRADIDTAQTLRAEAADLLAQYQEKQRDAQGEAETIIAAAQRRAVEIQQNAETELHQIIARKESQLSERLQRMEESAKAEIRSYAAELAVKATTEIIASRMDEAHNARLVDQAIRNLPANVN